MGKMTISSFFKAYRSHLWGKERKKKYYWGFLGDILGELILPTDEEIIEFAKRDFSETVALRYFLQPWIMPDFYLYTEESRLRIRDTLAWYLHQPESELDSIVNAFQIPIPIVSSKQFYTVIWQEFFLSNFPDPINPDEYGEDTSPEFINSLYKQAERPDWSDTSYYASPERIGTVRKDLLEWYSPERKLEEIQRWATTGIRPNNIRGLMSDATKWLSYDDMYYGILADCVSGYTPDEATKKINGLNLPAHTFFLLRRSAEDRKRGAIVAFNKAILSGNYSDYACAAGETAPFKYVITLDSDTSIINAERLVGIMEHPYNAKFAVMALNMRSYLSKLTTPFSRLMCGNAGVSHYDCNSDALRKLHGYTCYTGKGIYRVQKFSELTGTALPKGRILSHDFIEGELAGCGWSGARCQTPGPGLLSDLLWNTHRIFSEIPRRIHRMRFPEQPLLFPPSAASRQILQNSYQIP